MDIKATGVSGQLKPLGPEKTAVAVPKESPSSVAVVGSAVSGFRVELFDLSAPEFSSQSGLAHLTNNEDFDVSTLEYNGRSILDLSPEEATDLISEDGYYGVQKTADRLSGFVLNGGGDDLDRIRAGREGMIRGFKEAEQLWGGTLPEISYETLDLALRQVDARIQELGGSVINTAV